MNCPKCFGVELEEQTVGEVTIDRCPSCFGIWLDALELEKLLEADARELLSEDRRFRPEVEDQDLHLNCPRCEGARLIKLSALQRPGTIVDSCTVCYGMWLDAGEFTRLAHADLPGRLRALVRPVAPLPGGLVPSGVALGGTPDVRETREHCRAAAAGSGRSVQPVATARSASGYGAAIGSMRMTASSLASSSSLRTSTAPVSIATVLLSPVLLKPSFSRAASVSSDVSLRKIITSTR